MCPANVLPFGNICYEHPGTDDILQRKTRLTKDLLDLFDDKFCLTVWITFGYDAIFVRGYCAGNLKLISDLDSATVSDDVFPGGTGSIIFTRRH